MKNFLVLATLLLGVSIASAQPTAPGYGPGGYGYNITPYGPYGYYAPGFGMMGPGMMGGYGMGGMMGPGMMGGYQGYGYGYPYGGMMGGYGYAPGFGAPWAGYGYGFSTLSWVAVTILVAAVAYLLGKRRTSGS